VPSLSPQTGHSSSFGGALALLFLALGTPLTASRAACSPAELFRFALVDILAFGFLQLAALRAGMKRRSTVKDKIGMIW